MLPGRLRRKRTIFAMVAIALAAIAATALGAGYAPRADYDTGTSVFGVSFANVIGNSNRDLLVTSRNDGTLTVFRGKGNGTFGGPQPFSAGDEADDIAVADFNRDGRNDVAVADQHSPGGVSVLLGAKVGLTQPPVTYPTGDQASYLAVADFNRDHKKDIAVSNLDSNSISILKGNGHGGFSAVNTIENIPEAFDVESGDFNRDGKPDLAVTSVDAQDRLAILLGKGNGKFRAPRFKKFGEGINGVVVGKLNGDRKLDLVVSDFSRDSVFVLLGKGNGKFRAPHEFPAGDQASDLALTKYNRGPQLDVVVANQGSSAPPTGQLAILKGNGHGGLAAPKFLAMGDGTYAVASGDVNGDRKPDLAGSRYQHGAGVFIHN